jgi:SRSO17 transposase
MTDAELDGLGAALDDFLQPFLFCCGYTQTFAHLHTYCRGLLSDLQRKRVEPIALAAGCPVRTLQEFLRDHQWQHTQLRAQLQHHVADALAGWPDQGLGNVGLIDETSALKSGTKTPACSASTSAGSARSTMASSPSTSGSAKVATRP